MGLRVLFNPGLGFRIVESGMSNPMVGFFGPEADAYLRYKPVEELYCHSEILCEKVREVADFSWRDVSAQDLVQGTRYPNPRPGQAPPSPAEPFSVSTRSPGSLTVVLQTRAGRKRPRGNGEQT